jgi:hypothetical protein
LLSLRCPAFAVSLFLAASVLAGCGFGAVARPGLYLLPPDRLAALDLQDCGAKALAPEIGAPFTRLAEFRLKGSLRVLWPDQGVTRDLVPDRLNAQVDRSGRIRRLFCG